MIHKCKPLMRLTVFLTLFYLITPSLSDSQMFTLHQGLTLFKLTFTKLKGVGGSGTQR